MQRRKNEVKGTVHGNSNNPQYKDDNSRFTMVHFKDLPDQVWIKGWYYYGSGQGYNARKVISELYASFVIVLQCTVSGR